MSVALFSTAYFPPVAYVAALLRYDEVLIEAKETFPKQTYRNRMVIMTAEGVKALTVPVIRRNHSCTEEVVIDYKERWNVVHFRTLKAAYAASPYWLYYQDDIERMLMMHHEWLMDLNGIVLEWILQKLRINSSVTRTDDYRSVQDDVVDYRNSFSPKVPLITKGFPPYYQVFSDRQPFVANLSVLDLMMNLGPESREYLLKVQ